MPAASQNLHAALDALVDARSTLTLAQADAQAKQAAADVAQKAANEAKSVADQWAAAVNTKTADFRAAMKAEVGDGLLADVQETAPVKVGDPVSVAAQGTASEATATASSNHAAG